MKIGKPTGKTAKYFDISRLPVKQVILNIVIFISFMAGSCSMLFSLSGRLPLIHIVITLLALVSLAAGFYFSNVKKKVNQAAILICIFTALVMFPFMYFTGGGIYCGMPLWFAMGILFTFLTIEGTPCLILVSLEFLVYSLCMLAEYFYPQAVIVYNEKVNSYLDIWQSMISISLCVGMIIKFQNRVHTRQLDINEEQTKSLLKLSEEAEAAKEEAEAAKREAEIANRAKSDFLASMSHEIRTPINAVLGMDEMILRECTSVDILEYAQNIENSGRILLSLLNDILDFSKIEAGKMELVTAEYELGSLLHDCYSMIEARAEKKNLQLVIVNDPRLPKILYGDEFRLRQIFVNLLTNAVKYTNEGVITFTINGEKLNENRLMLKVSVKDTGIGISEENKRELFDSFKRLEEKRNRRIEGTGLGLSIVKRLVDLMDASIDVHSVYGKGTEFILEIPQIVIDWQEMGDFTERYSRLRAQQKQYSARFTAPEARILVVDDVQMNLQVVCSLLKRTRIKVDTATSGEECLKLVRQTRYNMIFMDHMMPVMDGVETTERMKGEEYEINRNTPVIMLTANAIAGVREKYLQVGFVDYLSKPVAGMDLEEMILKYLPEELILKEEAKLEEAEREAVGEQTELEYIKSRIPQLEIEDGVKHCGDSEDLYLEILGDYAAEDSAEKGEKFYEEGQWKEYAIMAHALKSTSLTVGLPQLAAKFKSLELAAKEENVQYLHENHKAVMEEYKELSDTLKNIFEKFMGERNG